MNGRTHTRLTIVPTVAALAAALAVAACGSGGDKAAKGKGGPGARGPAQVGYVVVQPSSAPITAELSARVVAYESAEVRPQVSGIVTKRLFTEGSLVRKGQTLYRIDPRLYAAAVDQARANVSSAQANQEAQRTLAERYRPLAEMEAISKQDYTNAIATSRQATASVAQNRASLETARINLQFTEVPAPISGRIGRSLFTVGALVTASQADPLTTIQRLDPIFVDIQQSSADLLALRRSLASSGVTPASANVRLTLEDGSEYGQVGRVEFSEVVVDQNTGTVTLRARFPNPQQLLFPGMFVRARFAQAIDNRVFLVPQQAVSRDARGQATLWIVAGNKAVQRTVKADRTMGANWVVESGLKPGDKVIVQGTANLHPGADIHAVPASAKQTVAPPQQNKGTPPKAG